MTNVIVFTISLGLADDNTIYFLYRFRQDLRSGLGNPEAIHKAFLGTGQAIVLTSTVLLAGLSVLFVPTRMFAELTTVTNLANLVGVLLLLPACLTLLWNTPGETTQIISARPWFAFSMYKASQNRAQPAVCVLRKTD